jgi:outer membrane receptor protein involved in Fe transport
VTQDYGSPEVRTEHNVSTLDGATVQFNSVLPHGSQLVWGAEYYTDTIDSDRFVALDGDPGKTAVRSRFPDGSTMDSAALYLSGGLIANGRLDLNAGLRYSWFDIRLPASDDHGAVRLDPSDLTGDLHAVVTLSPETRLVANVGRGFRPPNIFDLATLGPRAGNRFNVANTELDPETVWSYDLGFKAETGWLEFEVFAFYLDYADKITSVYTGEVTAGGRDVVRSENRNEVTLYGLEAGVQWALMDDLNLFAVVNYTRGEEHDTEAAPFPADRVPPLNGKLGFEYLVNGDWRITPYLLFAAGQDRLSPRDVRDPRIDPAGTDGWSTLNLHLGWQASPQLELGLRLENITDAYYREHASGIDAPGRNAGLWLNYVFP